jgi:hypothetical protein
MALIHCDFFSDVLGLSTVMTVILPQAMSGQIGMSGAVVADKHPTLYLLHGMSDVFGRLLNGTWRLWGWQWSCPPCTVVFMPIWCMVIATGRSSAKRCQA